MRNLRIRRLRIGFEEAPRLRLAQQPLIAAEPETAVTVLEGADEGLCRENLRHVAIMQPVYAFAGNEQRRAVTFMQQAHDACIVSSFANPRGVSSFPSGVTR